MSEQTIQQTSAETEMKQTAETAAVAAAEATWPQTRAILRLILIVLLVAAALWALYTLEGVLLLLVLAIFFAYLIAPLVELVHRPFPVRGRERQMPRALAIGLVYLFIFGSLGLAIYFLLPLLGDQISKLAQQAPDYLTTIRGRTQALNNLYRRFQLPDGVRLAVSNAVNSLIDSIGAYIQAGLKGLVGLLTYIPWLVLIPILAFFLLKDADSFRRSALNMLPRGRLRWRGDELFQDINSTLAAYIRAQLTACLLIGTICTAGFFALSMPYALVLGVAAGLLEFIPLAGPLTLAVAAITIASFHSVGQATGVFIFLAVLRIVQDYVLYPRIIGQGIHLHPLAVILAILCGAEIAGVAGIFLAIPVIAIISVTYRHWLEHRGADEGLVATLLKPAEPDASATTAAAPPAQIPNTLSKV